MAAGCAGPQKAPQPNIIFLMFDDLGYGDLGCYGQRLIETPNIDALAAQGILFTDMYASAPRGTILICRWKTAPWTFTSSISTATGRRS